MAALTVIVIPDARIPGVTDGEFYEPLTHDGAGGRTSLFPLRAGMLHMLTRDAQSHSPIQNHFISATSPLPNL